MAAHVIEIARSHIANALGVLVTFGDIRSGLAACITGSIGIH
jgi:isocitrate/isopropylmalate dehydrogenase